MVNKYTSLRHKKSYSSYYRCEWVDGWVGEWMDGWMGEWMDEWVCEEVDG